MKKQLLIIFVISLNLLSKNIQSAASGDLPALPLQYSLTPLPADQTASLLSLLQSPVQYTRDMVKLAEIVELDGLLEKHGVAVGGQSMLSLPTLSTLMQHLQYCSSSLGDHFFKIRSGLQKLSEEEGAALITLCKRSRATLEALPKEMQADWPLDKCEDLLCPTCELTNPLVRSTYTDSVIQEAEQLSDGAPSVIAFFASGRLAQEHEILKRSATVIPASTIIIIDREYNFTCNCATCHPGIKSIELSKRTSLHSGYDYARQFKALFDRTVIEKLINAKSIPKDAASEAFTHVLRLFSITRTVDAFKECVYTLYPKLRQIRVYGATEHYVRDCKVNPALKADIIIGCDFQHVYTPKLPPCSVVAWHSFHDIQDHCLKPSGLASSLTTIGPKACFLELYKAKTKETRRSRLENAHRHILSSEENEAIELILQSKRPSLKKE